MKSVNLLIIGICAASLICANGEIQFSPEVQKEIGKINKWDFAHPIKHIRAVTNGPQLQAESDFFYYLKGGEKTWLVQMKADSPAKYEYYIFPLNKKNYAYFPNTGTMVLQYDPQTQPQNSADPTKMDWSKARELAKSISYKQSNKVNDLVIEYDIEKMKKMGISDKSITSSTVEILYDNNGEITQLICKMNDSVLITKLEYLSFEPKEVERAVPTLPPSEMLKSDQTFLQSLQESILLNQNK